MKAKAITAVVIGMLLASITATMTPTSATHLPTFEPKGQREDWVHWVWVESEWSPPDYMASWNVYMYDEDETSPAPFPPGWERGDLLFGADDWMDYSGFQYELIGKTMQFEQDCGFGNPFVIGHPQVPRVVLKDTDGDGAYTGCFTAFFTVPSMFPDHRFFQVVIYEVIIDGTGEIVDFYCEVHQYYEPLET